MNRLLIVFLSFALLPNISPAGQIEGVRMWKNITGTAVVFDLSQPLNYRLERLANPERLVIDFTATNVPERLILPQVEGTSVSGLRYSRRGPNDLRVVLDLAEKLIADDILLPALEQYGDRLLLNLAKTHRADSVVPDQLAPVVRFVPLAKPKPKRARRTTRPPRRRYAEDYPPALAMQSRIEQRPDVRSTVPQKARSIVNKLIGGAGDGATWEVSGFYSAEARGFLHDAQYPRQHEGNASFAIQPELYIEWDNGHQSLLAVPFARWDQGDPRRTHIDLREFSYIKSATNWEFRAGVRKLFWGVAESNHLVDIVNQFDVVENIDNEDKLGQPMINVALVQDWGTVDVFALIGFRERTFPGVKGRLRSEPRVDPSNTTYDSSAENSHIDWALRYAHAIGDFDVGLYHFWGTSRDPRFFPKLTTSNELVLAPHYDIIHQTGTDIQATKGNWLYKFEGLRRSGQGESYIAAVGGFEYTIVGIYDTVMDLGVLAEYHFDSRGKDALSPFNNDLFTGSRLAFNDAQDSAVLAGISADLDGRSKFLNVEASRRLANNWKIEAELRVFWDVDPSDPFFAIRRDDYVQVELAKFF